MSIHSIVSHIPAVAPQDRHSDATDDKSSTPFPSQGPDGDVEEVWVNPDQRTVRRKKSSFDLRDVFKNGGVVPTTSSVSVL